MDDLRIGFSSFCLVLVFVGAFARSAEIEYISPERRLELESTFDKAEEDLHQIAKGPWICDMFGVKSSLQIQRGLMLYRWQEGWRNGGAQLVEQYQLRSDARALVGSKGRFEDEVKLTAEGQLISRLRSNSRPSTVLAYSVCKKSL